MGSEGDEGVMGREGGRELRDGEAGRQGGREGGRESDAHYSSEI